MSYAHALLARLEGLGGEVVLDGEVIRVRGLSMSAIPHDLQDAIKEHKPALVSLLRARDLRPDPAEVARRARIFRQQLREPGPFPFLHLPEARGTEGGCFSCGGATDGGAIRCLACQAAVETVLDLTHPTQRAQRAAPGAV